MTRRKSWGGRQVAAWRAAVVAAYGLVCCLCREPIDPTLSFPAPRSFSIEHVRPRSLGGPDTLANMRPCHLGCNSARGNRDTAPTRRPRRVGLPVGSSS